MKHDMYAMQNPVTEYFHGEYPKQEQPYPGLQGNMTPRPDCGEESYTGKGRLQGRKALVTGGDSGIGRAGALAFAREGADVVISHMPQEAADAAEVKRLVEASGQHAWLYPGDLSRQEYCENLVRFAHESMGGLDLIACVAGHQVATRDISEVSTEQFINVFAVNVFALFWMLKTAVPLMPEGASIITTTSRQAFNPEAALPDYAASKAAIKTLSQSLAKQFARRGIRINVVAPGPVWTPIQISGGRFTEEIPHFGHETPFGRSGQPVELASVYVFLASQESSYLSGAVIGATGGTTL